MRRNKIIKIAIGVLICMLLGAVMIVIADPGAQDDPLVSKSYIENQVIPKLEKYIDSKAAQFASGDTGETKSNSQFDIVELSAGKELIATKGTEMILRMGSAAIIATEKGGIADATLGIDLKSGDLMPSNHLLIVPVSDGRGIKTSTDVIVMVKGSYTIN